MTMLGAIALDGFRGFMTIEAATDQEVFLALSFTSSSQVFVWATSS